MSLFPYFRRHGILGINARNFLYIKPYNPERSVAFADDKLKTKAFLSARGIPTAKLYGRIETRAELREFDFSTLPEHCVLKPNFGFGGEGIIILRRDPERGYIANNRTPITIPELYEHIEDILDGKYSVNGRRDSAFFEQILTPHESLSTFRPAGLPDIRVIVFNLVPVMAMLRIPTRESKGRANIHLGGIGIGIDIARGITTHAARYNRTLATLPHGLPVGGHQILYWDAILAIAAKIQHITNIGFLAADITIDQTLGPTLLEVNARAGLMVQLANLAPLRARLERVQGIRIGSPEKGVRLGQDLFGEKRPLPTRPDDRPILGPREILSITGNGTVIEASCCLSPHLERSVFSPRLIKKLLRKNVIEPLQSDASSYRVKCTLGGKKIQTIVSVDVWQAPRTDALIGRRDLTDILIDPAKKIDRRASTAAFVRPDVRAVDSQLAEIDRGLMLLKFLKPLNLAIERQRLRLDLNYNPVFVYPEIPFAIDDIVRKLASPVPADSALGMLLEKKRLELMRKAELLRHRSGNAERFTHASKQLFGAPTSSLLRAADLMLQMRSTCRLPNSPQMSAEEAKGFFEAALNRYNLYDWTVSIRTQVVADCAVGSNVIYLRSNALFTPEHITCLIAHEIETHVLTAENGERQPYEIFRRGCANYLDTQEGLAIVNQCRHLHEDDERRYYAPRNLLGLHFSLSHSLSETRRFLTEELGYPAEKAITQAIAYKRGLLNTAEVGGLTKSVVYFRGLRAIEQYMKKKGDLRRLYLGKISLEDLENIDNIPGLLPPLLLPEHLR